MTLPYWEALLLTLAAGLACWRRLVGWLYLFQLDEYLPERLQRTAYRRLVVLWPWEVGLFVGGGILAGLARLAPGSAVFWALLAAAGLAFATARPFEQRGRLRWTKRARRLGGLAGGLAALVLYLLFWVGWPGALALGLIDLLLLLSLAAAERALRPYEASQRSHFVRQAEQRVERSGALVVGITGSYGKTTTKQFLHQLLDSPETPCFATPESFNTTLGVCRAINEGLEPRHRWAVVEMGAYRPGEIAEICSFTHPRLGIITAVGLMHLERFGSRQQVAVAKSELFQSLPGEGVAIAPSSVAERQTLTAGLRCRSLWVGSRGDRWWADSLKSTPAGTSFRLRGSEGEDLRLTVPVHGRHAVADLLCAWAAAVELGVSTEVLARRAAALKGAPHRLEVSRTNGLTIIDDAYNSNPDGAAEALRLLAVLPGERRVLVTPGFIELGEEEQDRMRELGRQAAAVCSHVILVGPQHSAPVREGLREMGFADKSVSVVLDLEQAQKRLPYVAGPGSVVLFENDLPDQYVERA